MKVTKSTYRKFLKYLCKVHPLADSRYPISLSLIPGKEVVKADKTVRANVRYDTAGAVITVPVGINPMMVLKHIGHEYRHLIQVMNMGWLKTDGDFVGRELDADAFGTEVAFGWARLQGW